MISKFFISTTGFFYVPKTHISAVLRNSSTFEYPRERALELYKYFHEPIGFEGQARRQILIEVFRMGWVRVRVQLGLPRRIDGIEFNVDRVTPREGLINDFMAFCLRSGIVQRGFPCSIIAMDEDAVEGAVGGNIPGEL